MSNLLDQAIVDAKALKEVAMRNAEATILDKFSSQIKEAVEQILEEDVPLYEEDEDVEELEAAALEAGGSPEGEEIEAPLANAEGADMCPCPDETYKVEIDLQNLEADLNALQEPSPALPDAEMIGHEEMEDEEQETDLGGILPENLELDNNTLEEILDEDGSEEVTLEEDLLEELMGMLGEDYSFFDDSTEEETAEATTVAAVPGSEARPYVASAEPGLKESAASKEEASDEIVEESLDVDIDPRSEKSGWMNVPDAHFQVAQEELLAMLQDSQVREEHEAKVKALKKLQESYSKLEKDINNLNVDKKELVDIATGLKNKLDETNLANAKLLYTNKVLMTDSLNERQKNKIVEALSNSENVEEAKVIYETLRSATGSTIKNKKPESLSEAMNKTTSTLILSHRKRGREDQKTQNDSSTDRWKVLAGLNKK